MRCKLGLHDWQSIAVDVDTNKKDRAITILKTVRVCLKCGRIDDDEVQDYFKRKERRDRVRDIYYDKEDSR